MRAWLLAGTVCLSIFTGCASTPKGEDPNYQTVEIISEPPGARIEVGGNYIGDAPITTKIRCWPDDKVAYGTVTIKAVPSQAGQFEQSKEFKGPTYPFDSHHDVLPTRVLFVMSRAPASPAENVNATPKPQ